MSRWIKDLSLCGVSVTLLVGVVVEASSWRRPADVDEHHARARSAAMSIPMTMGDWSATEMAVPQPAVEILAPNVIMSRRMYNRATGAQVDFLFVHSRDARALVGHYPPVCYVNQGWSLNDDRQISFEADGLRINATEYDFVYGRIDRSGSPTVLNFMLTPAGVIVPDMNEVQRTAADIRMRHYGAAQCQVIFHMPTSPEARIETARQIVEQYRSLFDAVLRTDGERATQ